MIRLSLAALLAVPAVALHAEEPLSQPIVAIKLENPAKLGVKPGKWSTPTVVRTEDELKKLVADAATRAAVTKQMNLKTHDLLVFCWQGSGGDKLDYRILESFPEQVPFTLVRGKTKDLRTHMKVFAVRKNVNWSTK